MNTPELHAEDVDRTEDTPPAALPRPVEGSFWLRTGVPLTLMFLALALALMIRAYNISPGEGDRPALIAMGLHGAFALAAALGPNRVPRANDIGISLILWLLCLTVVKVFKWLLAARCAGLDAPIFAACPGYGPELIQAINVLFWVLVVCVLPLVFRAAWMTWDRSVLEEEEAR